MAGIPDDEMGDIWPAAEPGRAPGDYGSATLSPTDPVPVRSFQTFRLSYTVGRFGLDDTGAIRVAFRWVTDGGALQTDDPRAMNHVTATASNGVPLVVFVEPYGYRPWSLAVRITVSGGYMREGERIELVFGDRSGGSPGMRMQTIAEAAFDFRVSVDACATGQFSPLSDRLSVPVVAGPLHAWRMVGPGLRRPEEAFALGLRAEDIWGNPVTPGPHTLRLISDAGITGLPDTVSFGPADRALRIDNVSAPAGTYRVRLSDKTGTLLATSDPIVVRPSPHAGYWGDLHGQSGETVGIGTIEEYLAFARDIAFLDVTGHQGNDFQISNAFWSKINAVTASMDRDGRFVVFPGYEWSGNTPVGGDHNVFFRHEGRAIRRSSHAMLADRADLDTDANTLEALFAALADEDCVLWSHVGGRPADVSRAYDPRLKTAVEVHSNWGTFEWILTDSLALGHRVGVVASSDGHKGRPGAGPPGATEFGAYGGQTCFLAPDLTREAIFECMRRRYHYGTSGSRIVLDVRARFDGPAQVFPRDPAWSDAPPVPAAEAMMGDIVRAPGPVRLTVLVDAPAPVERVDVMRGAELVETFHPYGAADLGRRVRVYWQGAEYRGRGRNTHWTGQIRVEGTEIAALQPINHWNLDRALAQTDPRTVRFDAVTSGNFAGVDLTLNGEGAVRIETNHVSGTVDLGALGLEDHVLDAGGLDRMIRLRRLPDTLDRHALHMTADVPLADDGDTAIWVRVTTADGHQAWSSPIYVVA